MRIFVCRLIAASTITGMAAYWGATILYCTPNNPLRIALNVPMLTFEKYAYQKWSFFAPPGKLNHRLYYQFSSPSDHSINLKVEVLAPIWKLKQRMHPLNEQVEVIDYIVSGSADMVQNQIGDVYGFMKVVDEIKERTAPLSDDYDFHKEFDEIMGKVLEPSSDRYGALQTLVGYSKLVAETAQLTASDLQCQITYSTVEIPKFFDRYELAPDLEESLVYRTTVFNVPK